MRHVKYFIYLWIIWYIKSTIIIIDSLLIDDLIVDQKIKWFFTLLIDPFQLNINLIVLIGPLLPEKCALKIYEQVLIITG